MEVILATHNKNKIKEFRELLSIYNIDIISAKEVNIDLQNFEETGKTFRENSRLKSEYVYRKVGLPTIADDSGLMVDILNGQPGIYSARYAGNDCTASNNIEKLLNKLKGLSFEERTARFVCSICFIISNDNVIEVQGECSGSIGFECKGKNGFGYDPIFVTHGGITFAELTSEEKHNLSHRGKAFQKLKEEINKNDIFINLK